MPEDPKQDEKDATPDPKAETEPKQDPTPDPEPKDDFDRDRALATIRKQRESEADLKRKLKEAEAKAAKLDEIEAAKLSDTEKALKEAEKAKERAANADSKLRTAHLLAELSDPKYGIVNARAAVKLIEGVEYNDDGEPTNLGDPDDGESLVAKFLTDNDFLRAKGARPKPPSLNGRESAEEKPPELTAAELEVAKKHDMTPQEYAAFKNGGSLADLKQAGLVTEKT